MTERLDEHKMKYAVDTDKEAEDICRWAAARAGVIVVAPVVGTMTLMANEVYMITRLAKLRVSSCPKVRCWDFWALWEVPLWDRPWQR